jgi:hypothetical protein
MSSSLNIIRVIKSTNMRAAGRVARMEKMRISTKLWLVKLNVRDNMEGLEVDFDTLF